MYLLLTSGSIASRSCYKGEKEAAQYIYKAWEGAKAQIFVHF